MAVFVSYSSRDRAPIEPLLRALRRAHEQVWFDEELGGGEAWWRTILDEIRGCDVFVVALSKNMLASKACQAELRYAQDLGKPILPVQVGPLDNMRINLLAHMQMIDYRDPDVERGIELVSSVHARRAMSPALPDPLPEEPPIPFAYLMRLASTISDPSSLNAQQQATLVAELKAGLDEDGNDASARRDITQLLCMLRDRSDVTWRTRTEVEAVLATLEQSDASTASPSTAAPGPPPAGPPPQEFTGPQPTYPPAPGFHPPGMPPPPPSGPPGYGFAGVGPGGADKKAKSGNKGLLIGGGVAAAVIAVIAVVAVVIFTGNPDKPTPPPPPSPPSTVAAASLTGLLLTPNEISSVVGTTPLEPGTVYEQLQTEEPTVSDTGCTGALFSAIKSVYQGSGYSAVVDQAVWHGESTDRDYTWMSQTAVTFPSADQANAFRGTSKDAWEGCDGKTVTVTQDVDHNYNWTLGSVTEGDSQISQMQTQEGMSGYACQHVLRTVSNVVIETVACNDRITDEADRMAGLIADKATE
jgi:serine/threonine kinase PknH